MPDDEIEEQEPVIELAPGAEPVTPDPTETPDAPVATPVSEETPPTPPAEDEPDFEDGAAYVAAVTTPKDETPPPEEPKAPAGPDPRIVQQAIQQYRTRAEGRLNTFAGLEQELVQDEQMSPARAKRIVDTARQAVIDTYADGVQYGGFQKGAEARMEEQGFITAAIEKSLSASQLKTFNTRLEEATKKGESFAYPDVLAFVQDAAREGYVAKKEHEDAVAVAFNRGRAQEQKKAGSGRSQPRNVQGEPPDARKMPDPSSPNYADEVDAWARNQFAEAL